MILLVSGGLDSIAIWRLMGCPKAINFSLRTESGPKELRALDWADRQPWATRAIWRGPKVQMTEHEGLNGYVPYRNLILVALAAQYDPHVVVPMIAEWAPDKNRRFFRRLERLLTEAGQGATQGIDQVAKVETPFAHITKAELLREYADQFGKPEAFDLLHHTWSCYHAGRKHCGSCSGCVQRYVAELTWGAGATSFARLPDVRGFIGKPSTRDAVRWLSGNGHLLPLVRRALEARRASRYPLSGAPAEADGRSD